MSQHSHHALSSRRTFLGQCCAAVTATGLLSTLTQLRAIGAIAGGGDYKALVCLFLSGGNDANNLIIPNDDTGYSGYVTGRGALALPRDGLLTINPKSTDGRLWALHPSLVELQQLFTQGRLALLANVGTLAAPITKAQFQAGTVPVPLQLYSHNDQQVEWMSSIADKPFSTGWGGRLADLCQAFNSSNTISMSISLNGQNAFQVGKTVAQYTVSPSGAVAMSGTGSKSGTLSYERTQAQNAMLAGQHPDLLDAAFSGITADAITDASLLSGLLAGAAPFTTVFPTSSLGQQLRMIARLIGQRESLGVRRQIFFARVGGWDLHDSQLGAHANLFTDLSKSLAAFHQATVEMGVSESVTSFTASDFGRTFSTNGDGSDHGWGSHHLVLGGAVNGGDIYGRMPTLVNNGPDDTGRGRWIPTTSVDEYSATLARWFGVSATDMPTVLPNIGRFAAPNLGFLP
ncbi:MAG: DUF1501 domain-containing protein [Opitutaceae bacterium]|nr:DUF1501 domain-containing protein [Opitutaceae bacterium]